MATGCNQTINIKGGPGLTSIQHVDYDKNTHELVFIKADGSKLPVRLKDSHVEKIQIVPGTDTMRFEIGDVSHGLSDTTVDLDISPFKNVDFATQPETDSGTVATKTISPALLKQWLANVVVATDATAPNAGKFAPLSADGKIDNKWLHHLAITDVHVAEDKAALDVLASSGSVGKGDLGIATAESKSYVFDGGGWQELLTPTDHVLSVNGKVGNVILDTNLVPETVANMYLKPGTSDGYALLWDDAARKWVSKSIHSTELGGKAFKPNAQYEVGDIVDHGNHIYSRKVAGGEAGWDISKWEIADSAGKMHSDAATYLLGEVVSKGHSLYTNIAAITTPRPWDPTDWFLVAGAGSTPDERGGVKYSSSKKYIVGDIVTDSGKIHICIRDTTGTFVTADWKDVASAGTFVSLSDTPNTLTGFADHTIKVDATGTKTILVDESIINGGTY